MGERFRRSFGAVPACLWWVARLGRRPRPLWEAPWAGAYRTRPVLPPQPPAPAPPAPHRPTSVRRQALGHGLIAAAFVAAGVLIMRHPRAADDRLCGLATAIFFGLCLWVFVEQMIHGGQVIPRAAGVRVLAVLGLAGGGLVWAGVSQAAAPSVYRLGTILGGLFLAGVAAWAAGRLWWLRRRRA